MVRCLTKPVSKPYTEYVCSLGRGFAGRVSNCLFPQAVFFFDEGYDMAFEHYIYAGVKRLRCGYTTGSCAALAAKAAASMLLGGEKVEQVSILTPAGLIVTVDVVDSRWDENSAHCGVHKDAGDDEDVTDGLLICAELYRNDAGKMRVFGGEGVGRVTKPGLEQPVGEAAINSVPRRMICEGVAEVCETWGYTEGLDIIISVPDGQRAATRTFNPKLGIVGGISIIGTSGIVEPRSVSAFLDSVELEIGQIAQMGERRLILTPGNYGRDYAQEKAELEGWPLVSCSNYIGDALDFTVRHHFTDVLLVGHVGKLIKLAAGIMNTHSRAADGRNEILCAHAALQGLEPALANQIMEAATTDASISLLIEWRLWAGTAASLAVAVDSHLQRRVGEGLRIGAIVFSLAHGFLFETANVGEMLRGSGEEMRADPS